MTEKNYARHASRRAGVQFKVDVPRRRSCSYWVHGRPKMTKALVDEMRQWTAREGWGLPRRTQAEALSRMHSCIRPRTIEEMLANQSWYDPDYVPGQMDTVFWGQASVTRLTLHVLRKPA